MPRRPLNVKKIVTAFCCYFTVSAIMLSGCKSVSEDPVMDGINSVPYSTVILTDTETQTVTVTDEPSAEVSVTAEETSVTSVTEEHTSETEAPSETASETTQTLQTESPSETVTEPPYTEPSQTEPPRTETSAETTSSAPPETSAAVTSVTSEKPYSFGTSRYSALNFREQKGIWISYLEYSSILQNKSLASFRKSIGQYFDNVKSIGFNTVYTQVRAYGDAYYNSQLFPSGEKYSGTMGAPSDFDALRIMVEEAHGRGLSIHAWVNPMRLMTDSQLKAIDDKYTIKKWYNDPDKKGKYIVESGGRWYLNPAYDEVIQLISDGIAEIVSNYDVDGIQIDDYFYPTTAASFDKTAYSASGTSKSLSQWRTDNVNSMVKKLCRAAHNANSTVVFGISPQGSIENNYNDLYADVKAWCASTAYCDYILPQIYFGFDNAALPYSKTAAEWNGMVSSGGVKLVIGLAGYKVGAADNYAGASGKNEWLKNSDILSRQMAEAKELSNYGGAAIFRYGSLFSPEAAVSEQVSKELENIKKQN